MKKILTFLVMLFVSVSILSAQDQQVPQAKFNYQAVVRDQNHDFNLVMEKPVTVTIEIVQINSTTADLAPGYYEYREVTTNRNGMVSFVIGSEEDGVEFEGDLSEIDWTNALIRATFTDAEGETLSVVENVVMPVPLALQAANDPMEITTDKIVEYLSNPNTKGEDVGAIVNALTGNPNVKDAVRDSIISYIKTQDSVVKELAIYFLGTVTVNEAKQAYDTLDAAVKQKIKQILVDSIKANRALAYQIAADYLKNTTKEEVKQLWLAARANEDFHEIFDAVRDSAIAYVMNHPQYMMTVAQYYIKYVLTYQDVQTIYQTLRNDNHNLYVALQNKFNDYLESYIGDTYVKACDGVSVCDLKHTLDSLKALTPSPTPTSDCPTIVSATSSITGDPHNLQAEFTVIMSAGAEAGFLKLHVKTESGDIFDLPQGNIQWHQTALDGGKVKFELSCPEEVENWYKNYKVHYDNDDNCDVVSDEYTIPNNQ